MENDPEVRMIQPIHLDINQIEIKSVKVAQLGVGDNDDHLYFVQVTESLKNDKKLLELELENLKFAESVKLSVVIEFVSRITNTLQGIYQVDYNDDFGAKEE